MSYTSTKLQDFSNKSYESLGELVSNWIDVPESIKEIYSFEVFNNSLIDWASAIIFFSVFYLFRKKLLNFIIKIFTHYLQKLKKPMLEDLFLVVYRPLKWKLLLIGVNISYAILTFSKNINNIFDTIDTTVDILLFGWAVLLLIDFADKSYRRITKHTRIDMKNTFIKLAVTSAKVVVSVIVFIILLENWDYDINGLLASLGLAGMAIALAAKDSARHIFGSIMIFTDSPFKVGDWIKTPEVEGTIEEIGMRSTKVRTFAQALVSVPNGNLADSAILNWSKMGKRRVKMNLGLTYSTTSSQMQNILNDIRELLKKDKDVHQQTIHIYFSEFSQSSLDIFCYFFTKSTEWGEFMRVRERLYLEIMKIVEDNKASFAFPSQSIYIEENKPLEI